MPAITVANVRYVDVRGPASFVANLEVKQDTELQGDAGRVTLQAIGIAEPTDRVVLRRVDGDLQNIARQAVRWRSHQRDTGHTGPSYRFELSITSAVGEDTLSLDEEPADELTVLGWLDGWLLPWPEPPAPQPSPTVDDW